MKDSKAKKTSKQKIKLPRTHDELIALENKIIKEFKLTDKHHASSNVCAALLRLPMPTLELTTEYLGQSVLRNIAYFIINSRIKQLAFDGQVAFVDSLKVILSTEPNNMEAIDELQKLADKGFEAAKIALTEFNERLDLSSAAM